MQQSVDIGDGSATDSNDDIPLETLMGNLKKKLLSVKSISHTFRWNKKKAKTEWKDE